MNIDILSDIFSYYLQMREKSALYKCEINLRLKQLKIPDELNTIIS